MRAEIRIKMDNAAFTDFGQPGVELARVLRDLATRVNYNPQLSPGYSIPLRDINGNKVGDLVIS